MSKILHLDWADWDSVWSEDDPDERVMLDRETGTLLWEYDVGDGAVQDALDREFPRYVNVPLRRSEEMWQHIFALWLAAMPDRTTGLDTMSLDGFLKSVSDAKGPAMARAHGLTHRRFAENVLRAMTTHWLFTVGITVVWDKGV